MSSRNTHFDTAIICEIELRPILIIGIGSPDRWRRWAFPLAAATLVPLLLLTSGAEAQLARPGELPPIDAAARAVIAAAGFAPYFIHRTGHGIGLDTHEDPYLVEGNTRLLAPGMAFSIEPGIYLPGRWGMRIEDIVVASEGGVERLNRSSRVI